MVKIIFDWPTPDPWVANVTDEHYLGYSDTKHRQKLVVVKDERFKFQYLKKKISRARHADLEIKDMVGFNTWQTKFLFMSKRYRLCGKPR